MSTNSPAKQERIERHLMRQRGAGVRTVSASFGFCFGSSSAPPSDDHTPVPEESAPKRRKTTMQSFTLTTESNITAGPEAKVPDATKDTQSKKARRRLDLEKEEGSTERAHVPNADDSFVRVLETKKAAAKKSKEAPVSARIEEGTSMAVAEPVPKGRSKRRAALKAESKVTDGFAEEGFPVNKKKQYLEPHVKPRKARKKQDAVAEISSVPGEKGTEAEKANESIANDLVKERFKRAKTRKVTVEVEEDIRPSFGDQNKRGERDDRAKPSISTSWKDKKSDPTIDSHTTAEVDDSFHMKSQKDVDRVVPDPFKVAGRMDHPKRRSTKKNSKENTKEKSSKATTSMDLLSKPLKEIDTNSIRRSTSPDKSSNHDEKAHSDHIVTVKKSEHPITMERASTRPSKRRTVRVRQGHEDVEENLENVAPLLHKAIVEETSGMEEGQPINCATVTKPDEKTEAIATANTSRKTKKSLRTDFSESKQSSQVALAKEEDVDWLFDSQQPKQQPVSSQRQVSNRSIASKARTKMPEIDLDDLLSNIASFAKTEDDSYAVAGSHVGVRRTKVTAKRRRD